MRVAFVCIAYGSIGVEYLSAALRRNGHETKGFIYPFSPPRPRPNPGPLLRAFCRGVLAWGPDLIAASFNTLGHSIARLILTEFHRAGVRTVAGGIQATLEPDLVLDETGCDYLVRGEGEIALPELCATLEAGSTAPAEGCGVWTQSIRRGDFSLVDNLEALAFPDRALFKRSSDLLPVLPRRGCPYARCRYCLGSVERFGRLRVRAVDSIMDEIQSAARERRVRRVHFYDSILPHPPDWFAAFLETYRRRINLPFLCSGHPTLLDRGRIRALREAGCEELNLGIQSWDLPTLRDFLDRPTDPEQMTETLRILDEERLPYTLDHILNLPSEDSAQLDEGWRRYRALRAIKRVKVYSLLLFPGIPITADGVAEGWIRADEAEQIRRGRLYDSRSLAALGSAERRRRFNKYAFLYQSKNLLPMRLLDSMAGWPAARFRIWTGPSLFQLVRLLAAILGRDRLLIVVWDDMVCNIGSWVRALARGLMRGQAA